ncbi:alpha/beta hydrolase [Ancylobacter terrae]|uniref:alpha/beta hydrolase n=1 Tax=Ancylobacter sp. sgz301288 TaxID=3342077 RepID=UPI00385CB727
METLIPRAWGALLCAVALAGPAEARITRDVEQGGLHGTLTLPDATAPPVPAVLILAGSGPVDRDGNMPGLRNDGLKQLGDALAEHGIASLRIDKRGVGASAATTTREDQLRIDTYVADAVSWIEVLRQQPEIARVVMLGHSEGALVATLAAQQSDVAGLVLVAGAGDPAPVLIERQLAAAGAPRPLQEASRSIAQRLARGEEVEDVPPELSPLYRTSVQPYMVSWFQRDPAAELGKTTAPVLILQGGTDLQVDTEQAWKLASARPGAQMVVVEGMNHVLKSAPANRAANLATYGDAAAPLAPGLVPAIAAFVAP